MNNTSNDIRLSAFPLTLFIFQVYCISLVWSGLLLFYKGVESICCWGSHSCSASFCHLEWLQLGSYHRMFNRLCQDYLFF